MPSRLLTATILAFWLATSGWFFAHDLWPRLRPGRQAPFTVDLAQEVNRADSPRIWNIFRNGATIGNLQTLVRPRKDDTYALWSRARFQNFRFAALGGLLEANIQGMESMYRVTRTGEFREVDATVDMDLHGLQLKEAAVTIRVHGLVKDGTFTPHWTIHSNAVGDHELDGEPVEVATNHSMLSTLQPWNRLLDVQENRRWQIQLFDPVADSLAASLASFVPGFHTQKVTTLEAGVLQGAHDLTWGNREVPCLVIEYRGEDISARTWVRQVDGLVLRQEAYHREGTPQQESLTLERVPQ